MIRNVLPLSSVTILPVISYYNWRIVERIWFVLFRLGELSQRGLHKERRQNCSFGSARCEGHAHRLARQSERHHHQMYGCEATYSSCNIHMWNMWLWNLPGLELVTSPCVSGFCRDISKVIGTICCLLKLLILPLRRCLWWTLNFLPRGMTVLTRITSLEIL